MSVIGWVVRTKNPYGEEQVWRVGETDKDAAEEMAKQKARVRSARALQTITSETVLDKPLNPGDVVLWL